MPRNERCVEAELAYHVTQRGVDHQDVFFSRGDRNVYLGLAEENIADCQVQVLAWCLMRNHVHWVLKAGRKNSLAVFFRRVHGRYAQYLNARRGRNGHLWQNRFFSCPLGPSHLWRALRYVESNPVRAGLANENLEYRWSSAAAHTHGTTSETIKLLDWDLWREIGGSEIWRQQAAEKEGNREIMDLRECTYAGRHCGDIRFVEKKQEHFNRQWRPVGRPRKNEIPKREMGTESPASLAQMQISTGSG